jgi:hypothetical protein
LAGTTKIELAYGDVILQSAYEYSVNWTNPKHTFCFAAPFAQHIKIEDCAVSGDSNNQELFT